VAWVGQGTVADRTQEHLGESDRGVILMRRRMLEEAEKVRAGEEPKAVIWDPNVARRVDLPIIDRDFYLAGFSLRDIAEGRLRGPRYSREFVFQAGQPAEITEQYRAAMGMERLEEMEAAARAR
jgi:5,5'-dehydrodivanillate O-demethylase